MWRRLAEELDLKSKKNGGMLKRGEMWSLEYYRNPYLTFSSDEYLHKRFIEHSHNTFRLTSKGKIATHYEFTKDDGLLGPLFAHMNEEFGIRGGIPVSLLQKSNGELLKYFENDPITGVKLFRDYPEKLDNVIVKFGQQVHLSSMLRDGQLRLSPAEFYQRNNLHKAMQDTETDRDFHVPQFQTILDGKKSVNLGGFDAKLEDGFFKLVVKCPEYLLWSACLDIDRRMPDDFGANAALIIRDPRAFLFRLKNAVKSKWPAAPVWAGPIKYYDPCSFVDRRSRPETIEHFSYYYQREWRFCAFPNEGDMPIEPIIFSIGALEDIAELVTLS